LPTQINAAGVSAVRTTIYRPTNDGAGTIYATNAFLTRFVIPSYTTQVAACYVEAVEISDTYVDDNTFNQHPYLEGYTTIITDPNVRSFYAKPNINSMHIHADYVFYARMTALGQYKKVFP